MIFTFIDETSDSKFPDYFGLSSVVMNSAFYQQIKNDFQKILLEAGWNPKIEFKGSFLFSASKGCVDIPVEKRVEMATRIIELNVSKKNARMKFVYLRKYSQNHREDYLNYLPLLLEKAIKKSTKKGDKDLISLHCDYRSDISKEDIFDATVPIFKKRNYTLFEDVVISKSCFNTVGILYADIVGYLFARIETISNDSELFENISREEFLNNGKIKKLLSSIEMITLIKKFEKYEVKN